MLGEQLETLHDPASVFVLDDRRVPKSTASIDHLVRSRPFDCKRPTISSMHSYRVKYGTREGWGVMETNQFFSVGDPFPDRFGRWVVSKMLDDPTDAYVCSLILAALPRSDEPVIRLDIRLEDLRTSDLDPEKGYIELTPSEAESLRNRLADTLSTLLEDQADGQHQ